MGIFEQSRYFFNYVLPSELTSDLAAVNHFFSNIWWIFVIFVAVLFIMALKSFRKSISLKYQAQIFDDFFKDLSSKKEIRDIELSLLKSIALVGAKYAALYALRGETYILVESNTNNVKDIATPLRLAKKELIRFKKSGNYVIEYFTSSSKDMLMLFYLKPNVKFRAYSGFFEIMLGFYEQSVIGFKSKSGEALLNVSKDTSISLMKLQMDQDEFFKFFTALILKITKAKGAKLLTKDDKPVFQHLTESPLQKIFFIRNTPFKLEFYDDKPLKSETMAQVGSFLDMAGSFLVNLNKNSEMVQNYLKLLEFTNQAVELENVYYKNHSLIVKTISVEVAKSLFLSQEQIDAIAMGASFHDIGMIGDLLALLNKDKLEIKDMDLIKEHPLIGSIIVEPICHIYPISDIIKYHHERFDAKGYPFGLKGAQIPIEAQVVAVGEFYSGITGARSYKKGKTHKEAVLEIKKASNKMFGKAVVDAFLDVEQSIKIKIAKITSSAFEEKK